jgi:hypothetical protein
VVLRQFADWTDTGGEPERELTKDEMLDDISLYWLTNTATFAAWEQPGLFAKEIRAAFRPLR